MRRGLRAPERGALRYIFPVNMNTNLRLRESALTQMSLPEGGCTAPYGKPLPLKRAATFLALVVFISAVLFSTTHLALHHSSHNDKHCLFCKYSLYSKAEEASQTLICRGLPVVETFPTFSPDYACCYLPSLQHPRGPPFSDLNLRIS